MPPTFLPALILAVGSILGPARATSTVYLPMVYSAPSSSAYSLVLSRSPDRSNAVSLQGQDVSGDIYVFLSPDTGARQVCFYLDNTSASGVATRTEDLAPYDLAGGTAAAASPFDTTKLRNGWHTVTAVVDGTSGSTLRITSTFAVNNEAATAPPPSSTARPTVTLTPTATATPPATPTPRPTATATSLPTATLTATGTATARPSVTPTATPRSTATATATATATVTPTATRTSTATATVTAAATVTPAATQTSTAAATATATAAPTVTPIATRTSTATATATPTATVTRTATPTSTATATAAPPATPTSTATATRLPTATFTPTAVAAPPGSAIYWGVNMSGVPGTIANLTNWERDVAGKAVSIVHWGHFWGDSSGNYRPWSNTNVNNARSHGSIPMISWTPEGGDASRWQLQDIIGGQHDAYIRQFATDAKSWGFPFLLRIMHEMNGSWGYNWQETQNGNSRGEFVLAWRHIVDIFRQVGVTTASYVWCPNIDYPNSPNPSFASLYPGDSYVDWTCLDGYNWGTTRSSGWQTFDQVYNYSYNEILKVAPSKPMMIGEFGSVEQGGSKAAWFTDALTTQIPTRYTRMRAAVYFNFQFDGVDWRIESSTSARDAWRSGIASSYYYPNQFSSIVGKVAVP